MSDTRVVITAQAEQAVQEFERLRLAGTGSMRQLSEAGVFGAQGMGNVGMSVAQVNQQLQFLPHRIHAIADSITAGQQPMTILIQQGGELVSMFGGAGAAAKAVGGYVLGLVNPTTVAAAAVAVLGYAYYNGAAESRAFNEAITMSGNAAGVTFGQLTQMARAVSQTVGTQGAAAEALTAMVATGKVSASDMIHFSTVAVEAQRALGQSVGDTAAQFADLAKTPVQSLEKLNDKYHFLTGSVYEHVKALQDQGRSFEASTLAQQTYATAFDGVTKKVTANLGTMEKFWNGVKGAAKETWDAMLNVGREDTLEDKLNRVQAEIAKAEKPFDAGVGGNAEARAKLAANLALKASLEQQIDSKNRMAAIDAGRQKFNDADLEWSKTKEGFLNRQEQLANELASVQNKGLAAGISDIEINKELAKVRMKYSDIYNDGIDSNIAALKRRSAVEDLLSKRSVDQISFQRSAGMITEEQAIEQTTTAELAAFDKRRAALVDELALIRLKQNSQKDQKDKLGEIAALDMERVNREIKGKNELFLLDQKIFRQSAENFAATVDRATSERDSLRKQLQDQSDYNDQIGLTKVQLADLSATRLRDAAAMKEQAAVTAYAIDATGQLSELYREQAQLLRDRAAAMVAGAGKEQTFEEWSRAVQQYGDVFRTGFADMLNRGKDGWKSFTQSLVTTFKTTVADQIYKMFAQPYVIKIVASILGISASTAASMVQAAGGSAQAAGGAGSYVSIAQSAKLAYDSISSGFANLSTSVADGVQAGMSAAGYYPSAASGIASGSGQALTPFAEMAGTAAGYAGGIAAGKVIGGAISGQYEIGGHGSAIVNIGTVAGAIFGGPIGAAIGGTIGGLLNRAFGMGPEQVTSRSLTGTLTANSFSGTSNESYHQDGGWFRSDYNGVHQQAVDATASKALSDAYQQIKMASADFASTLGIDATSIATRSQALNIAITTDAAANQKAVSDFFVGVGDTIANELVPSLGQFSKQGEAASATFQRIAGDYAFLDTALGAIGKQFGAVGIESVAARERLVDLSGGVDAVGKGTAFFAQNFLSETERMAPVAASVKKTMDSLNLSAVTNREQFKNVVLGLDLTTAQGAATYASLMKVEEAFAQVHPAIDETTTALRSAADILSEHTDLQKQIDELTLTSAQLREKERLSIDASNLALFDRITQLQNVKATGEALKTLFDNLKSGRDSVLSFSDSLKLGSLSTLTPMQKYLESERQYSESFAKARSNPSDSAALSAEQTAATTFLTASQLINASSAAFIADRARVLGDQSTLADIAGAQMSDAQRQLALAGDQVTGLATLNTTALGIQAAIVNLGAPANSTAPTFDLQRYSATGTPGADALVAEIKRLNARIDDLVAETKGRRADAERQAGDVAHAIDAAGETFAEGVKNAGAAAIWRESNPGRRPAN